MAVSSIFYGHDRSPFVGLWQVSSPVGTAAHDYRLWLALARKLLLIVNLVTNSCVIDVWAMYGRPTDRNKNLLAYQRNEH